MSLNDTVISDEECSSDDDEMFIANPFFSLKQYMINNKYCYNFDYGMK